MAWTQADEKIKNDIVDFFDKDTTSWIEEKAKDITKIMSYYRCAMMEIETKFKVLNIEYSLKNDRNPISSIKTRLKDMQSIRGKFERKSIKMSLDALEKEINDIAGVRVVCSFPDDVYEIAEALLKQDDVRLIEMKDYIKNPKPNGYRSLHIIVEIPIFLSAADFVYFYALSLDDAMISIVSMIRRGSVLVTFLFGALVVKEKNIKSKAFDLLLILIGMVFLYLGSR